MNLKQPVLNRERCARCVFGFALLIFVHRYFTHTLLHQMQRPTLFLTEFDYTYWFYQYTRLPEILVKNSTGALFFDGTLLISTLYAFITAGRRRAAVLICAVCWTLYGLTYNSYSSHHNHTMIGIMVLPYAFLARKTTTFQLVWDGFRYFCLYIYADAFLNKTLIFRNIYYVPNGVEFIKTNQSIYMLQHPASLLTELYTFFLLHPWLAYLGFVGMILLQGCMLIGFFTKKWDKYLLYIPIVFHSLTFIFVDVFFFELLILNLTLLPFVPKGDSPPAANKPTA